MSVIISTDNSKIKLNKIYNIKCEDGLRLLEDNSIDLTVTSPPYSSLRTYGGNSDFNFEDIAAQLYRVTKSGGTVVWITGDETIKGSESGESFRQALHFKQIGFNIHDTMIYMKHNFSNPSSTRYHQIFEYMFILTKGSPKTFNPIKDRPNITAGQIGSWGKNTVTQKDGSKKERPRKINTEFGMRYNIWKIQCGKDKGSKFHPAVFPIELVKDLIISWSNNLDTILDPFMGAGTTAMACKLVNRNYIGFEANKNYYDESLKLVDSN